MTQVAYRSSDAYRELRRQEYHRNIEQYKQRRKQRYHEAGNKDVFRAQSLKQKYGITLADYNRILLAQGGICKICGSNDPGRDPMFQVDHDHKTGKVRGLLCSKCNTGLAKFRDSAEHLRRAAAYLEEAAT